MPRIEFKNTCGCTVDYDLLSKAIHYAFPHFKKNKSQKRSITVYGRRRQPAIYMKRKKYPVSRLIAQFLWPEAMNDNNVVHHKDGNPLNNLTENLKIVSQSEHSKHHHTGLRRSPDNSEKGKVIILHQNGYTLQQIADIYKCGGTTIHNRLKEWGVACRPSGTRSRIDSI